MKTILWCTLAFVCGLAGGVLYSCRGLLLPAASSAAAFAQWQEMAAAPVAKVDAMARERLLMTMTRSDPTHAWEVLTKSGGKPRMADIEQVGREWGKMNGHAAAVFGQAIAEPIERNAFLTAALSCWYGSQPRVFLEWLKTQPDKGAVIKCMTYLEYGSLLKSDVAALDDLAELYAGGWEDRSPLRNLARRVWQRGNPNQKEDVLAWLRRQPKSDQRDYAWRDIAGEMAPTDARAAASLAAEVTSPRIRRSLSSTVAAWMAKADVPAALVYAESLPDEASGNAAWQSAFGTWLMNDPAGALDHVSQHLDTITTDKVKSALGMEAAVTEEELKVVRLMKGTEESRNSILYQIMSQWKSYSQEDMRRWLASPEAEWVAPDQLKRFRQMAEAPDQIGGGTPIVKGRRIRVGG